jgi:hypothetical protein
VTQHFFSYIMARTSKYSMTWRFFNRIGGVMWSGQTTTYIIVICCFSLKHTALNRKGNEWLVRNQDNVSEWSDMSTRGLLCQWASTPAKRTLGHQLVINHRMDKYSGAHELSPVFSGVRVTWSLDLCVCFVDRCLYFCPVFGHCVVCSSSKICSRMSLKVAYFNLVFSCFNFVLYLFSVEDCLKIRWLWIWSCWCFIRRRGVRVTWSLDLCVCFVDRCLYFCPVFGHCVVCSSSIYGFWLLLWCIFKLFSLVPCRLKY